MNCVEEKYLKCGDKTRLKEMMTREGLKTKHINAMTTIQDTARKNEFEAKRMINYILKLSQFTNTTFNRINNLSNEIKNIIVKKLQFEERINNKAFKVVDDFYGLPQQTGQCGSDAIQQFFYFSKNFKEKTQRKLSYLSAIEIIVFAILKNRIKETDIYLFEKYNEIDVTLNNLCNLIKKLKLRFDSVCKRNLQVETRSMRHFFEKEDYNLSLPIQRDMNLIVDPLETIPLMVGMSIYSEEKIVYILGLIFLDGNDRISINTDICSINTLELPEVILCSIEFQRGCQHTTCYYKFNDTEYIYYDDNYALNNFDDMGLIGYKINIDELRIMILNLNSGVYYYNSITDYHNNVKRYILFSDAMFTKTIQKCFNYMDSECFFSVDIE